MSHASAQAADSGTAPDILFCTVDLQGVCKEQRRVRKRREFNFRRRRRGHAVQMLAPPPQTAVRHFRHPVNIESLARRMRRFAVADSCTCLVEAEPPHHPPGTYWLPILSRIPYLMKSPNTGIISTLIRDLFLFGYRKMAVYG
ncbi:MAG: hypothetical protein ACTHJV_12295, partial [Rhizobiaceae bacterium]